MPDANNVGRYSKERIKGKESLIKVAAIQTEPRMGDKEYNVRRQIEMIKDAMDQGALLIVLPELGNTGYVFNSRHEVSEMAEEIPGGTTCQSWAKICEDHGVYICGGLVERHNGMYFNSAALLGPKGFIGKYRKTHLWDEEKLYFEPGDLGFPVFDLAFGRFGIMICYDAWFPEAPRILALQGVDVICDPTAWVTLDDVETPEKPLSPYVHLAGAHINGVFMICADRIGSERGCKFLGMSCIAGPNGFISGPASPDREEILTAEINVVQARYKNWTELSHKFADRRTDLYDKFLGHNPVGRNH